MRNNYAALEAGWIPGDLNAFKPNAVGKICLYDSGGGGGGPTETTSYQTNLPEYAEPYYTRMVERGEALSQEGYQPYGAERIAGFNPAQQAVFGETLGMQTPTGFAQGQAGTQGALGLGISAAQQGMDPMAYQQYMSPYQQSVTDIAKRKAAEDARMIQQATNLGAARQGTYGGARQVLAQTERERALGQQLTDIQTKGLQDSYTQAVQRQQQAAGLGLQAGQFGLQGSEQLARLGTQEQAADLQRMQAQQSVANAQQQMQQRRLDQSYQDFLAQREYPYRQLEFYNAMLRGMPVQANTTSSQYQQQPNIAQQVLGYGIPALALSKAFSAS